MKSHIIDISSLLHMRLISVITVVCLIQSEIVQSQIRKEDYLSHYVFKGNHLGLVVSALSVAPAQLSKKVGEYPISTDRSLGIGLGVHYSINLANEHFLRIGIESQILGSNIALDYDQNNFSPSLIRNYKITGKESYMPISVIGVSVLFGLRKLSIRGFATVDAGLKGNVSSGADASKLVFPLKRIDGTSVNGGQVVVNANNETKPWISFTSNAGYFWLLRNNNLLGISLVTNLSLSKVVSGSYSMRPKETFTISGAYASRGSFLGISLNYIFTNANYRIRKAIQGLSDKQ